jgi:HSP20 family molecular chaperone IbpA
VQSDAAKAGRTARNVGTDKIKATFKNGVLEVHLPKVEKARGKKVEIKVE